MANEITVNASLKLTNGNLKVVAESGFTQIDQTTARGGNPGTVNVGTSEEVISFGDISSLGYCYLRNLDTTNYVEFGPESGGAMVAAIRLEAGQPALMPLKPGTTYRAQANTAACNVQIVCIDR